MGRVGEAGINELFEEYRKSGGEDDLIRLIESGKGLVYHFIRLYSKMHEEDLVQVGIEGLLKAVRKFDAGAGVSFVTYASHCVMGEIRHHIRKEKQYYRPGCVADLQGKIERYIEERLKETGIPPGASDISKALNVKEEGVVQAMRAGLVSLEELDLAEVRNLKYETFKLPIEDKIFLDQAVRKLSELQQKVIRMLFYREMTQEEAARELGVNQRKVSRLLHKSLDEMAAGMEEGRLKKRRRR